MPAGKKDEGFKSDGGCGNKTSQPWRTDTAAQKGEDGLNLGQLLVVFRQGVDGVDKHLPNDLLFVVGGEIQRRKLQRVLFALSLVMQGKASKWRW